MHNLYMTTRKINKQLLRKRMKEVRIERIALTAGCSASLIQKLIAEGYETIPSIAIIDGICEATGETLDSLFPIISSGEKETA